VGHTSAAGRIDSGQRGGRFELGSRSWRECSNKGAREAVDIDHGEPRRRRRDHDRDFISDWWPSWVLAEPFRVAAALPHAGNPCGRALLGVSGLIDILNALADSTGDLRGLLALIGLTTAVSGAIVLACPGVTILVVAIVIGVQLILAGLAQIVLGLRFRPA